MYVEAYETFLQGRRSYARTSSATPRELTYKVDVHAFTARHDPEIFVVIDCIEETDVPEFGLEEGLSYLVLRVPRRYMEKTNNPDLLIDHYYRRALRLRAA